MDRVLQRVLRSFIQRGTLRLTTARGTTWEFGDGSGKPVVVRFTTPAAERAVLFGPELAVGECYMSGTLVIDQGTLADPSSWRCRRKRAENRRAGRGRSGCSDISCAVSRSSM